MAALVTWSWQSGGWVRGHTIDCRVDVSMQRFYTGSTLKTHAVHVCCYKTDRGSSFWLVYLSMPCGADTEEEKGRDPAHSAVSSWSRNKAAWPPCSRRKLAKVSRDVRMEGRVYNPQLGDKYERRLSDNVCLGFRQSRSRRHVHHYTINSRGTAAQEMRCCTAIFCSVIVLKGLQLSLLSLKYAKICRNVLKK